MEPSTDQIFTAMQDAVLANPSLKSKFNAHVEFHVEEKSLALDVSKDGPNAKPADLVVTTSLATLHKILNKKLTPQQAFMQGKLKIKGNMGLAMKLTLVVNATRKELTKQSGGRQAKL